MKKKVIDKIEIFRDMLDLHEFDEIDVGVSDDIRVTKMESLLNYNYQEFLDVCNYLSNNNIDPKRVMCYQDKDKHIVFEIDDGSEEDPIIFCPEKLPEEDECDEQTSDQ